MSVKPFISIIIPMRNEERYIGKCLDAVVAQDYPKDKMEVLVVDGMSTDKSKEVVSAYGERYPYIKVVDNPKGLIAAGLNVGLRESKGEIVVRMDAHAYYYPDYVSQCVWHLLHTEVANVGGPQVSVGSSFVGRCIAYVVSSKFGVGGAVFRYGSLEQFTETAFLGAWRRETLVNLGGWNEEWVINEDQELNARILEKEKKYSLLLKFGQFITVEIQ